MAAVPSRGRSAKRAPSNTSQPPGPMRSGKGMAKGKKGAGGKKILGSKPRTQPKTKRMGPGGGSTSKIGGHPAPNMPHR